MAYTLGDAAKATGKTKPTISKAIKSGRISAIRLENGSYQIEPSELHRVYPPISETGINLPYETPKNAPVNPQELIKIKELEVRLEAANEKISDKEAQLDDIKQDRDKWRQQANSLLENKTITKGFFANLFK